MTSSGSMLWPKEGPRRQTGPQAQMGPHDLKGLVQTQPSSDVFTWSTVADQEDTMDNSSKHTELGQKLWWYILEWKKKEEFILKKISTGPLGFRAPSGPKGDIAPMPPSGSAPDHDQLLCSAKVGNMSDVHVIVMTFVLINKHVCLCLCFLAGDGGVTFICTLSGAVIYRIFNFDMCRHLSRLFFTHG